jgi:HPt (histidine-containing phosphotransfer) domain-containing protein
VSDWPSALPGLDLTKALSQLGGKKTLFVRLLGMFESTHTEDVTKIKQAYEAQDWKAVHELNHALKGVSGNLAANELFDLCNQIDAKLKQGDHELEAEVEKMVTAMATVLVSMAEAKHFPTD